MGVESQSQINLAWEALKIVAILVLLVPLIYFSTRLYARKGIAAIRRGRIRVIDSVQLGPNRFLAVVRVGTRVVLVGVTDHSISHISDLPPEDWPDEDYGGTREPGTGFKQILASAISRSGGFRRDNRGDDGP